MEKSVVVFPVLPGKDAREVAAVLTASPAEYRQSRLKAGVSLERAWEQTTPMGTVLVVYGESSRTFAETTAAYVASDLAIDRAFVAAIKEVHGFDISQAAPGDPPELLADWTDETRSSRKSGMAFCAPIRPDAAEPARLFAKRAWDERREELAASRRSLGITQETVMLNHTPAGDLICVYLEGDDPVEGNRRFAASREPFDVWFKSACREIFTPEIDFDEPVPPVTLVFDSGEI